MLVSTVLLVNFLLGYVLGIIFRVAHHYEHDKLVMLLNILFMVFIIIVDIANGTPQNTITAGLSGWNIMYVIVLSIVGLVLGELTMKVIYND